MLLQPKNWAVFQHYKDRCPPWIKLHRDLLNNREFICLPIASKALAPMLWLLASETKDGIFDASVEELCFRLRITEKEYGDGVKPLIDKGFFVIASGVLADRYQRAIPETEGETEAKKEKETKKKVATPDGVTESVWQDWLALRKVKRAAVSQTAVDGIAREARKASMSLQAALEMCCQRGWTGFKADWVTEKVSRAEKAQAHMHTLTRGLSAPKPFWSLAKPVLPAANVTLLGGEEQ
jgi:hypothetical protein